MSTSATERTAFSYLLATILVAVFGGVYEVFSHGVWSAFMVYAFAFPLILGVLPFSWLALQKKPLPGVWSCRLHHAGVTTLTVGSVMEGALAIYGTTNHLTIWYWIVGCALLLTGLCSRILCK